MNPSLNDTVPTTPEQDAALDERLDGLRFATGTLAAPAHLEATLMQAFKAHHAGKRRS